MNNTYQIITDSSCDLTDELAKNLNLEVLPLYYTIENKTYKNHLDHSELSIDEFYEKLNKGKMAITSQVNVQDYIISLTPYLENNKDIIIISFSSGLSGTYNSACVASEELKEKFPNKKITAIDSKCASLGQGLLVYLASMKQKEGLSYEELVEYIENTKLKINHWFTVTDIKHLRRGGRISTVSSALAQSLAIKPVMHVNNEGKLIPITKKIGRKNSLRELVTKMEKTIDLKTTTVFLSHGNDLEAALYVKDLITKKFKVDTFIINHVGPVIGAHAGNGVIALFFEAKER